MERLTRKILWGAVLGVILYALIGLWSDARAVGDALARFPWWVFAGALGLSVVNYGLRFAKWQLFLRTLAIEVPWRLSLNVFLAGFVMSVTPGKLGEVLKSALLRDAAGVAVARTAPIVVAERLTDLMGLVALACLGLARFDYGRWGVVACVLIIVGGVAVLSQPRLMGWMIGLSAKGPGPLPGLQPKLEEAYASMRALLGVRVLGLAALMSVASWGMEGLAFAWILDAMGATSGPLIAIFLFSVTTILGAISFLPGGLGVTEGTLIGGLLALGVLASRPDAVVATTLVRLATLWFGVGLGVVALAYFKRRQRAR